MRIGAYGALVSETMLDHARNLLSHCERGGSHLRSGLHCTGSISRGSLSSGNAQSSKGTVVFSDGDSSAGVLRLLQDVYRELTAWLLVPRLDEAEALWKKMFSRGWTVSRIEALNSAMRQLARMEALAIVSRWDAGNTPALQVLAARKPSMEASSVKADGSSGPIPTASSDVT